MEDGNVLAEKGTLLALGSICKSYRSYYLLFGAMLRFTEYVRSRQHFGYVTVKRKRYRDGWTILKNEKFIKKFMIKVGQGSFDEAIDRVGDKMIAKNFQTNAVLYKAVGENIAGQNRN